MPQVYVMKISRRLIPHFKTEELVETLFHRRPCLSSSRRVPGGKVPARDGDETSAIEGSTSERRAFPTISVGAALPNPQDVDWAGKAEKKILKRVLPPLIEPSIQSSSPEPRFLSFLQIRTSLSPGFNNCSLQYGHDQMIFRKLYGTVYAFI